MADSSLTPPSSPRKLSSALLVSECIEELVRFTLSLSIHDEPEVELGLSKKFVASLLEDESDDINFKAFHSDFHGTCQSCKEGTCGGVPRHPLYKELSKTLLSCIISGTFPAPSHCLSWIKENENLSSKRDEWTKLITENGLDLVNMLQPVSFEIHVQEPYYSQLRGCYFTGSMLNWNSKACIFSCWGYSNSIYHPAGNKIVEGRCAVGEYKSITSGSLLLLNKCLLLRVQIFMGHLLRCFESKGLANVLPGLQTIEEGIQVYREFYTEVKERSNGVVGFTVSKHPSQPYVCMAKIISGLNYEGLGSLLGLKYTSGTAADELPPPPSALASSFLAPQSPHVEGSSLTVGARALAKHVHRSCSKWWGVMMGSDSDKNNHAVNVVNHLITHCCWINIHSVKPHGLVLEIREREGYGARWSNNGLKFIGFLEPYTSEGHANEWRH